jgi:hypothetical protein
LAQAQRRPGGMPGNFSSGVSSRMSRFSGSGSGGQSIDSLEHRDPFEDSLTITFQLPNVAGNNKLDSSITDFTRRFPVPANHVFLGNTGAATRSILFSPNFQSGWDHGFHALDVYRYRPENARFFNTTRPFTELAYHLGSRSEHIIELTHTQNIRPNWNALFQYRMINSPGFLKSQRAYHNNYVFTSWYQSVNKRYNNYFSVVSNVLQSDENGGIRNDKDYLNDPIYNDRFNIPVNISGDAPFERNFFSTKLNTGHRNIDVNFRVTQQYDLGKKDSLVSDSTVIPLFFPRLRFEHTFQFNKYKFLYLDNLADSLYYASWFHIPVENFTDTVYLRDRWKEIVNDFSIYQFPDAKNLLQYIKAGVTVQNLRGDFAIGSESFFNVSVHGDYRNKTRNRKWDMSASGVLYVGGAYAGDYHASLYLKKFSGKKQSFVELGFRNVNRTPSFIFDSRSSYYFDASRDLKKENITNISASVYLPVIRTKISGNYFLAANYVYFTEYYKVRQQEALFNLLMVSVEKTFSLGKNWKWQTEIYLQQVAGNPPVNIPLFFTRNRIGYEGNFGLRRLTIATGFEIRYHSPYKADNYSAPLGNYFYQDSIQISNRPDISAYVHFKIRNFRAFLRAENLNTVTTVNGFGFRYHNFAAPDFPYQGLLLRLGIFWNFVN